MTGEGVKDFLVPDLGEGLDDATITSWNVAVGDEVELNQTLCTVETNKAEVEIPSPYAGRIVEVGGAEGDTLNVGSVLVRIATDAPAATSSQNGKGSARKPVLVGYGADDEMDTSRRTSSPGDARPRAKPPVRKLAAELNVDLTEIAPGSGPDGVITREDVLAAAGRSEPSARHGGGAWCSGRDGASNGVVAQGDTRCACRRSGRLLGPAAAAGPNARRL